jgi:polyvinyl alcohol dehydrogenase (cytochrome)
MHRITKIVWSALIVFLGMVRPSCMSAADFSNWGAYLHDPAHSSVNQQATAITPVNATALVPAWDWKPDPPTMPGQATGLNASPTVYNGRIYIGARTGVFYALDETTGAVVWKRFLAFRPQLTCVAEGIAATATVAIDPSSQVPTVYVHAPDGKLYALDASNGAIVWSSRVDTPSSSVSDYYSWSSPTVTNGKVYVGVSSECDKPLVRGGVKVFQQATGKPLANYYTVPVGGIGGSVWSSVASSTSGDILVTTGNGKFGVSYATNSIVRLDGLTLAQLDIWTIPLSQQITDGDFGGSPTIFQANLGGSLTPLVGACNKNGKYYALRINNLAAGPVWAFQAGDPDPLGECIAAAIWDGSHLFVASNSTRIGGVPFNGSIRELDPATGTVQTGLSGAVFGSPTKNGAGVIALATYQGQTAAYLVNASNGRILKTISNNPTFAQPVFADRYLFVARIGGKLTAYKVGP